MQKNKFEKIIIAVALLLCAPSCFFNFKPMPAMSVREQALVKNLATEFRAEGVWTQGLPVSIMNIRNMGTNGFELTFVNSKIVNPENPMLGKYCGIIVDSFLVVNNYTRKYKAIKISFEKSTSNGSRKSATTKGFLFNEADLDTRIGWLTSPGALMSRRVLNLFKQKQYEEMIPLADSAIILSPENAWINEQLLGLAWLNLKDTTNAMQHFCSSKKLNPKDAMNYIDIAWIYSYQKKYKMALAILDTAFRYAPQSGTIYYVHSKFEHESGNDGEACIDARKADSLGSDKAKELMRLYCK